MNGAKRRKVWRIFGGVAAIVIFGYLADAWLIGPLSESPHRWVRTRTASNAREIVTALLLYASDYDGRLPNAFDSESGLRSVLDQQGTTFGNTLNPNGGTFLPNANLAGVNLADIDDRENTVLIYESLPWPGGMRITSIQP